MKFFAVFILRRLQQVYCAKREMLYVCFIDQEKAFDKVQRKVL